MLVANVHVTWAKGKFFTISGQTELKPEEIVGVCWNLSTNWAPCSLANTRRRNYTNVLRLWWHKVRLHKKLLPAIVLFLKFIHEYCFVVVSPSEIRSKYNSHVYDANTVVINTIYRCVLSVLLAELHSYAYTGHCSQACICMYKEKHWWNTRIINTVKSSQNTK